VVRTEVRPPRRLSEPDAPDHHAGLGVDLDDQSHAGGVGQPDVVPLPDRVRQEVPLQRRQFLREGGGGVVPSRSPRGPPVKDVQVAQAEVKHTKVAEPSGRLGDINSASQAELESLPGVGPVIVTGGCDRRMMSGKFQAAKRWCREKPFPKPNLEESP